MKILRYGKKELVTKSRKFECDNCKCVFVADKDEYLHSYNQLDGDIWGCNCPCCGKAVITSEAPLFSHL